MARLQFNKFVDDWSPDVSANATNNGVANAKSLDTSNADSVTASVNIKTLGSNKKIAFKWQESVDNSTWVDVADGVQSNLKKTDEYDATGAHKFYYIGSPRYVRLVVVSKTASPAATVAVVYRKDNLSYNPDNTGF